MTGQDRFAQVILPLAVEGHFTYSVPEPLLKRIAPGSRVLVSFGKKRIYSAIVKSLHAEFSWDFNPKPVLDLLDDYPMVRESQLQLWEWMSAYYMCTTGEVMRAALPSGLRPESESRIRISSSYEDRGELDRHERLLFEVVREEGEVTPGDLQMAGVARNTLTVLKRLVEKGAVEINEFMRPGAGKRVTAYIRLAEAYRNESSLHMLLDQLARAPRQLQLLEAFLETSGTVPGKDSSPVLKRNVVKLHGGRAALAALLKKGVLEEIVKEEMGRHPAPGGRKQREPFLLNQDQEKALSSIREQFQSHQAVLLQGVTSSGKTEVYIHLITEMLERDRQVLFLLPEIALTTQIIERIKQVFGERVGVFHSRYSDARRVHVYRNLMGLTDEDPYRVIIGVRSAIFLPFKRLGLVIVDEEHETTYKQHDPAPRYHARDSAQVLALYHDARVLLGSATPSFESLYNARTGKYGFATIPSRFGSAERPEIILANTAEATKRKQMISHFTPQLMRGMEEALAKREQVILFQNRRGYSNYLICNECGHIPKCERCDVSLTHHRVSGKMECHYCGHKEAVPHRCPSCGSTRMSMKGFGTEKIEDEIALIFEGIRIGRLDTDAARSVRGYEKVIRDFESGKLDLLIGTQMLSKGLDFENVSLVGVLDADSMLHFPDFRAFERSFQLIAQVSGRAGRRGKRGKVIIQTMDPSHPVIQFIYHNDYEGLYAAQMEERQLFGYPPFRRMIRITFRHRVPSILDGATDLAGKALKKIFSNRVYGPQYPPVRKIHNTFQKQIILKIEREASYERARSLMKEVLDQFAGNEVYRSVRISINVDPY